MKRNLANRLTKFGMVLVSTKFGIHGDWMVDDENGMVVGVFTTLGSVRKFVESLENDSACCDYIPGYDDGEAC